MLAEMFVCLRADFKTIIKVILESFLDLIFDPGDDGSS